MKAMLIYAPILSVGFNIIQAACSLYLRDYARAIYWTLAAGLVACTIWMR